MHWLLSFFLLFQQLGCENRPWRIFNFMKAISVKIFVAADRRWAPMSSKLAVTLSSTLSSTSSFSLSNILASLILTSASLKFCSWLSLFELTLSQFISLHLLSSCPFLIGHTRPQTIFLVASDIKVWSLVTRSAPCSIALEAEWRTTPPWPMLAPIRARASPPSSIKEAEPWSIFPVCFAEN